MLLERGVVGFRRGNVGFEQHPAVDGQPPSVEGLDLVCHRDVGVQVRVAGPAVPVGERGGDQAADVDLPDALRPGPGEQGMLLDERQRVLDRGLMGLFDHSRHRRIGDRPQGRDRLHRGERQVIAGNCSVFRPRVFRDLSRQLSGIHRLAAMRAARKTPGHLGPHPLRSVRRQRRVRGQAGCGIDRRDAFGHLEPERADVPIEDLERRAQLVTSWKSRIVRSGPSSCCWRSSANGCRPQPNNARICSAVTGSPALRPSIPSKPEPIHTPGVSPRSV